MIQTQFAFLGHEASHRQVLVSGPANDRVARILANAVAGISYGWWISKHTRHHAKPNTIGKDPDIEMNAIAFLPETAEAKRGLAAWLTRRQGYLFFPLLTLEGINLHFQSLKYLVARGPVKSRALETSLISARLAVPVTALFLLLPWGLASAFLGLQLVVFGVYMGASFAPNHKGMPLIPKSSTIDFFSRQVLTSRDIVARTSWGNRVLTAAYGGLNYQVEHHLFPSMARPQLRAVSVLVQSHCRELGVPYTAASVGASYGQVVSYLNRVGLAARDPFDCPLAAAYRRH